MLNQNNNLENILNNIDENKFNSFEEELNYLKDKLAKTEIEKESQKTFEEKKELDEKLLSEIKEFRDNTGHDLLHEEYKNNKQEIILKLTPETHDINMGEFWDIMNKNGIWNTLNYIKSLNSPHLEDDFHRFLIEFLRSGNIIPNFKENDNLNKALNYSLFEVSLPEFNDKENGQKSLKELLSSMEQFFLGMLSIGKAGDKRGVSNFHFAIELAVSEGDNAFVFYVSVPNQKNDLFEKQILSVFPRAKIDLKNDDYNIFNNDGVTVASIAEFTNNEIYPIKTYENFDNDPLNVILNSLSKIAKDGEGASIQIIFNNVGDYYNKLYRKSLEKIHKGESLKESIDIKHTLWGQFNKAAIELGREFTGKEKKKSEYIDNISIEQITKKISTLIVETNIRLLASSKNRIRSEAILSDLEASFNQFKNTLGNSIKFKRLENYKFKNCIDKFIFREFDTDNILPLSLSEITTLLHFPIMSNASDAPQLKQAKSRTAPIPMDMPTSGVLIGQNMHRGIEQNVYISPEDRVRHMYVIGQTGVGKSSILKNLILQDIENGDGVCFIDPHGSDVNDILSKIPKERYQDVIYFDPSHTERPMALNMLEYDPAYPEQKTFVVNELFSIFQKLYSGSPESMGPMFEQYFRNATMLVIEDPETGNTLLDVSRVMAVKSFRDMKVSRCKNPIVKQFWTEVAEKTTGDGGLANMVPYITSKFDVFLANDIMRPIIAQEKSSFNFRQIMDDKKILLVNLAKGRLGEINSSLIGLIIVGKILMAALSRVDSLGKDMPAFYFYIDEFQNTTTPSISTILSEARKYKLALIMAHQFIAQLDEGIKNSVFGNVGNMIVYRVGVDDAEYLEKQFSPMFTANDLINIDNFNAYVKMLASGKPTKPFSVRIMPQAKGNQDIIPKLKELSYLTYGEDRALVEERINDKYKTIIEPIKAQEKKKSLSDFDF